MGDVLVVEMDGANDAEACPLGILTPRTPSERERTDHYHPIEFDYEIHEIHETRAGAAAVS